MINEIKQEWHTAWADMPHGESRMEEAICDWWLQKLDHALTAHTERIVGEIEEMVPRLNAQEDDDRELIQYVALTTRRQIINLIQSNK